jgi:hypothetical protein
MTGTDRASGPASTASEPVRDTTSDAATSGTGTASAAEASTAGASASRPPRVPPTIDLKATELAAGLAAGLADENAKEPADEAAATDAIPGETTASAAADKPPPRNIASAAAATGLAANLVAGLVGGLAGGLLVLIALIGLWLADMVPARDTGTVALQQRVAALTTQLRDLSNRPVADNTTTEKLAQRLASLEQTVANTPRAAADPALAPRIATTEQAVKASDNALAGLSERVAAQSARVDTLEKTIADVANTAATSQAAASPASSTDAAANAALAARLDAVERSLATQADAVRTPDSATRRAVATLALRDVAASGSPFTAELSAVRSLGIDATATAALAPFAATGLPSVATLLQQASTLLPAIRQAAETNAPRGSGFLDRLEANASRLVRIRPVGEATGSDPVAILARVEDHLAKRDLSGTLMQLKTLPPSMRAPAEEWIGRVEARQQALDASHRLAAEQARRLVQP